MGLQASNDEFKQLAETFFCPRQVMVSGASVGASFMSLHEQYAEAMKHLQGLGQGLHGLRTAAAQLQAVLDRLAAEDDAAKAALEEATRRQAEAQAQAQAEAKAKAEAEAASKAAAAGEKKREFEAKVEEKRAAKGSIHESKGEAYAKAASEAAEVRDSA